MRLTGLAPLVVVATLITPGTGSLSSVGVAPANDRAIVTSVGSLTAQGVAPTVEVYDPHTITPSTGELWIGEVGLNPKRTPGTGSLSLTGIAPTVVAVITEDSPITPTVGSLSLAGAAPSPVTDFRITPDVGGLGLGGAAPVIGLGVVPQTGALSADGVAPSTLEASLVTPQAGSLTLQGVAPTVGSDLWITPSAGSLTLAGVAPELQSSASITPDAGALALAGAAPTVSVPISITPSAGALTLSGLSPVMDLTVTPSVGSLAASGVASRLDLAIRPSVGTLDLYYNWTNYYGYIGSNFTRTPNAAIAPDGTLTADMYRVTTTGPGQMGYIDAGYWPGYQEIGWRWKCGFYAKAGTGSLWYAEWNTVNYSGGSVVFNVSTGTIVSGTGTITDVGNGWYYCESERTVINRAEYGMALFINTYPPADADDGTLYLWKPTFVRTAPGSVLDLGITPQAGSLSLDGVAPTVRESPVIVPQTGSLTAAGVAPTVGSDLWVTPDAGALTLAGVAPSIETGSYTITPQTGILYIGRTGGPEISKNAGALALTGYAPTVSQSDYAYYPGVASVSLVGYAPKVVHSETIPTFSGSLSAAGVAPTATAKADRYCYPTTGRLVINGASADPRGWAISGKPTDSWGLITAPSDSWATVTAPSDSWSLVTAPSDSWSLVTAPSDSWTLVGKPS